MKACTLPLTHGRLIHDSLYDRFWLRFVTRGASLALLSSSSRATNVQMHGSDCNTPHRSCAGCKLAARKLAALGNDLSFTIARNLALLHRARCQQAAAAEADLQSVLEGAALAVLAETLEAGCSASVLAAWRQSAPLQGLAACVSTALCTVPLSRTLQDYTSVLRLSSVPTGKCASRMRLTRRVLGAQVRIHLTRITPASCQLFSVL